MTLHYNQKGKKHFYTRNERIEVHKETRIRYGHLENQSIDDATWKKLIQDNAYYFLLDKALYKLTFKAHTEQSLFDALEGDDILRRQVLDELKKLGYINDERLLEMFIREYEFEKRSLRAYQEKLQKKGFKKTLLDKAFAGIEDDQEARLKTALDKKAQTLKADTWMKTKERLMRYAVSLGYPYSIIQSAIAPFEKAFDVDPKPLLKKELSRLKKDPKLEPQKIIERLRRKGFSYDLIKQVMKEES